MAKNINKKGKPLSLVSKKIIIFPLLIFINLMGMDAKPKREEMQGICPTTAYIHAGHEIILRKTYNEQSQPIAKIQDGQYVCYFFETSPSGQWAKIKVVPFLNNLCDSNNTNRICKVAGNFPITWLSKKPKGKVCKLHTYYDDGDNIAFKTTGTCATGWVQNKYIIQIGD